MKNEAHARIKINQLLTEAGWRFFDNEDGKANILLENHVKITQQDVDAWGNDEEQKNHTRQNLLKHCGLDTLAMVRMLEVLRWV